MRHIFSPQPLAETVTITGQDAHHLKNVLRAKIHDVYTVCDGEKQTAEMEIISLRDKEITFRLLHFLKIKNELPIDITLVMCLPKADKMTFIVQKAVELGVKQIQPVVSRYSVVKYDEIQTKKKQEKWQKTSKEAASQCARQIIPRVEKIMSLEEFLSNMKKGPNNLYLFCYEEERKRHLKSVLKNLKGIKSIYVIVGAEGGFSKQEYEKLIRNEMIPVCLGNRILRAETAAIATLAILQYECEHL